MCDESDKKLDENITFGDASFGVSVLNDFGVSNTTQKHDQAFVDDLWSQLSPIKNGSPTFQKLETKVSVSSTPLEDNLRSSNLTRNVKRRRKSKFSEETFRLRRKLDEKAEETRNGVQSARQKETFSGQNIQVERPASGESTDEILPMEKTVIPSSFSNPSSYETCESAVKSDASIIPLTDSLQMTTELNSKLTTTFDDIIMSEDGNLTNILNDVKNTDSEAKHNSGFYGLPLSAKEILKTQRGISELYGKYILPLYEKDSFLKCAQIGASYAQYNCMKNYLICHSVRIFYF